MSEKWMLQDVPAEKLRMRGLASLTDREILSTILGVNSTVAFNTATALLTAGKNLTGIAAMTLSELNAVPGMTLLMTSRLAAAFELGRRRRAEGPDFRKVIRASTDIFEVLKPLMEDLHHEVFYVMFLRRNNSIICTESISSGGITGTVADPRLILRRAIELRATSMILAHNHPSGNLRPSQADEDITNKIKLASGYLDIKVLDHIIISSEGYYSFADEGMI